MPLPGEYRESIVSKVADLKNANYNGASSIKAGLFLNEFTGKVVRPPGYRRHRF
jgi:leucyl aminopeptidase